MNNPTLGQYIDIAPRFRRSIHLESDFGKETALDGYVVSPLARDLAQRVVAGFADSKSGTRAWSIVGPYGTGKSSFLTYIGSLVVHGVGSKASDLTEEFWPEHVETFTRHLEEAQMPLVPMLITGQQTSLSHAFVRGAKRTAEEFWSGPGSKPNFFYTLSSFEERLEEGERIADSEIVDAIVQLAEQINSSSRDGGGLCIIIDEMGKFLEYAATQGDGTGDIYLLQLLAEASTRSEDTPLLLITTLHQGLDAYAEGLPRAKQVEWSKISGRFETVPFLETPRHLTKLIAGALHQSDAFEDLPVFDVIRQQVDALFAASDKLDEIEREELIACAPLHPIAALCLGPLFRTRFGQNERSLFAFLTSREPYGFQEFLAEADDTHTSSYSLPELYDYILFNTGARVITGSSDRTWAAAQQALSRLPGDADKLEAMLIKSIAILSLVGVHLGIKADLSTLANVVGATKEDTKESLERLIANSSVVFRQFKQAYHVWDGSDLNIPELIEERRNKVKAQGGFAKKLQKLFPPYPVVASRHYYETGTLRHLAPSYVDVPAQGNAWPVTKEGDGDLLLVVPDELETLEVAKALVSQPLQWLGDRKRPLVVALPRHGSTLLDRIIDYFAIEDALRNTPELSSDPVGRRELADRRLAALDRLTDALADAFTSSQEDLLWYWQGRLLEQDRRVSSCASRIFDEAYKDAPIIKNELINRTSISSHASGARRILMELLMEQEETARLGIESYPAELSLYRSILEWEGLHKQNDEGVWEIVEPSEGSSYFATWKMLDEFLEKNGGERIDLLALEREMAKPPLGIREGVARILLLLYYLTRRNKLFLYEDNSFMPVPGSDMVQRYLKKPSTFELQLSDQGTTTSSLMIALGRELGLNTKPTVLNVVKAIVRFVSTLSPYATRTQQVSEEARRVRNAVKGARDPVRLLFQVLPSMLSFDEEQIRTNREQCDVFAKAVADALRELGDSDQRLLERIDHTIKRFFGGSGDSQEFYGLLAQRAAKLEDIEHVPMRIRNFVSVTSTADATNEFALSTYLQGAGTAILGKPPSNWTDEDVRQFEYRALESSRDFLASEELLGSGGHRDGSQIIRVSVLDGEGNEHHGISTTTLDDAQITSLRNAVTSLAVEHGIEDRDAAFAVIAEMMNLISQQNQERSNP